MRFQDNLRKYRERLGINAKDFAAKIDLPYTKYIAYENKNVEPKYDTLCKIATALHVSVDDLLGYEPDRLRYWLDRFPDFPLYADVKEDDIVISNGSIDNNTIIATLSKADFIKAMEQIERETQELINTNHKRLFGLMTIEHFMIRRDFDM